MKNRKAILEKSVAEYFAGIGLVRLGLEKAGWKVIFANDFSQKKFDMYNAQWPDAKYHYNTSSIFDLDAGTIPPTLLATSSFPCIDLSLAGNMNGIDKGKHSSAFWGFVNILRQQAEYAPPIILVENVQGWLYSNEGKDFRTTVKALNNLGYTCDIAVLDAIRFTPQSRPRVFLIGTKYPPKISQVDELLNKPSGLLSKGLVKALHENSDLKWMHLDWPVPPSPKKSGLTQTIIENIPDQDERWWVDEKVQKHLMMMSDVNRARIEHFYNIQKWSYRTFFRRRRNGMQRAEIRDTDTAGCLRTAVGGSSRQFMVAMGYGKIKMRNMTPREYARLQGVPDHYPITVDENQALTGFGDAVCVPAITWIAENVLNKLARHVMDQMDRS